MWGLTKFYCQRCEEKQYPKHKMNMSLSTFIFSVDFKSEVKKNELEILLHWCGSRANMAKNKIKMGKIKYAKIYFEKSREGLPTITLNTYEHCW